VAYTTSSIAIAAAVVVPSESVSVGLDGHVVTISISLSVLMRERWQVAAEGFGVQLAKLTKLQMEKKETRRSLIGGNRQYDSDDGETDCPGLTFALYLYPRKQLSVVVRLYRSTPRPRSRLLCVCLPRGGT
jgi:hypothetical protein